MKDEAKSIDEKRVLRFISGRYQGAEYPLPKQGDVVVGRSSELDIVLVEEMVSRVHAKFVVDGANVALEDMGSTNGTYVNGARVTSIQLALGDRVLIGTSIIRLTDKVTTKQPSDARRAASKASPASTTPSAKPQVTLPEGKFSLAAEPQGNEGLSESEESQRVTNVRVDNNNKMQSIEVASTPRSDRGARSTLSGAMFAATLSGHPAPVMSGTLTEVSLVDLLQLFGASKKSGVFLVSNGVSLGRIYLSSGNIQYAEVDGRDIPPDKAFYRMVTWEGGSFELVPQVDSASPPGRMSMSVQGLLMEGMRQLDEWNRIVDELPGRRVAIRTPASKKGAMGELSGNELVVYQLALRGMTFGELLDASELPDADVAVALVELLNKGFVEPGE